MRVVSLLIASLALSLGTVSSLPAAHAADEKPDAKKKKPEAKPAEKKPEAKPAEKKPEVKPAEKKPDEKAKPADKKPEEKKPEEKKPEAKPPASSAPPPGQLKPATPQPAKPEPVVAPQPVPTPVLDIETLRSNRGDRRKATVARSRQLWGAVLNDEKGTAELRRHSFLIAALNRILGIATAKKDEKTVETVNALLAKEEERHTRKMSALRAGAGGQP